MKKILCFIMVVMLIMALCSFSVLAAEDMELSQKFYDYCVDVLPEDMQPDQGDDVNIIATTQIDGNVFFFASSWHTTEYADIFGKFGDCNIYSNIRYQPYELGVYAASGDEIYTLEEAYNNGMITDVSALESSIPTWYLYFFEDYAPNPENKYESDVIQKLFSHKELTDPFNEIVYMEKYEYYSDMSVSDDEATPDYVLIYVHSNVVTNALECNIYGDYVLQAYYGYIPFTYGYGIYIPETGEIYALSKAYEMGIEGIEKVFTEAKVGRLMGDMDNDRKLTIKDATYIQKVIAGFEGFSDTGISASSFDDTLPRSIADFNRDRDMNIKDATAIQKYLAGIE